MLQRGHSGDGCDLALTLCKYDLRKGDLFVLFVMLLQCMINSCHIKAVFYFKEFLF